MNTNLNKVDQKYQQASEIAWRERNMREHEAQGTPFITYIIWFLFAVTMVAMTLGVAYVFSL